MPHAGHFIGGRDCQFFLNTCVGDYVVSTVGEYLPDAPVREIFADSRGIALQGKGDARLADYMKKIGFEDIGYQRKYETMVFRSRPATAAECCPFEAAFEGGELDMDSYNEAGAAFRGHLALCLKWMEIVPTEPIPPKKTRAQKFDELREAAKNLKKMTGFDPPGGIQ